MASRSPSRWFRSLCCVRALIGACLIFYLTSPGFAQSTAFTYQGKLKNGDLPANGLHDFRFSLFDAVSGGAQVGTTQCVDNVQVVDGVFTATIDFGQQFATPAPRFLQIQVRADSGLNCATTTGFITLAQRQAITPTPVANHAKSAFSLDAADGSPANAVFVDNDGKVGVGTTSPAALLHVKGAAEGVRVEGDAGSSTNQAYIAFVDATGVRRGYVGDGSTGDNSIFVSSDTGDVILESAAGRVVNVTPTGNVGIGTTAPAARLDVRGNIKLGDSSELLAPGAVENLRVIRGRVGPTGTVFSGTGFTASRQAEGQYRITFATAFSDFPTCTATADFLPAVGTSRIATVGIRGLNFLDVHVFFAGGGPDDGDFDFIAVGPR